jgi:hypothetical protein
MFGGRIHDTVLTENEGVVKPPDIETPVSISPRLFVRHPRAPQWDPALLATKDDLDDDGSEDTEWWTVTS